MAHPHAFHPQAMNKGTLLPGQAISVNKFNVQVERYLSQGGFAHVYLVRTPVPVYNTTHHVLKRIAVPTEHMLTEVKKEVDIMRLLKGHPNIVHLIDAAWHRMADGTYEVFILMEFCPGGGIIDMMNRRLRERLTEAEILQIFVDVCEGVAFMHNSRPPLLHRDLKVENILQASPTSFKLCDFGSASTVGRPPSTTQEIRALEADLNRHTTLQYRAPEMVDPYLRRPVDEKSDVWALGVLLYKLCYYTTPFEEHGPLAILNVQYKIPPYPVYSSQMNALIASMLREHGAHRPSVFELLSVVHQMRGTKSQFTYNIPAPQPLSPARQLQFSNHLKPQMPAKPAESTVAYRTGPQATTTSRLSPSKNTGTQQKERIQEPIAPMRRGRPAANGKESLIQPHVSALQPSRTPNTEPQFAQEEERSWKAVTQRSDAKPAGSLDDAWNIDRKAEQKKERSQASPAFGDDFAENLWKAFDPAQQKSGQGTGSSFKPSAVTARAGASTGGLDLATNRPISSSRPRDAFDGLGIGSSLDRPAPTLGEARKLRTGLAVLGSSTSREISQRDFPSNADGLLRPSPSPNQLRSQPPPGSPRTSHSPMPSSSSWKSPSPLPPSRSGSSAPQEGQSAETRFPSLEELDASFATATNSTDAAYQSANSLSKPTLRNRSPMSKPSLAAQTSYGQAGSRSQQVTGTAMKDDRSTRAALKGDGPSTKNDDSLPLSRPALVRKHRSSVLTKPESSSRESIPQSTSVGAAHRAMASSTTDWLTGSDDADQIPSSSTPQPTVVVRQSPEKRTSYIERSHTPTPMQAASIARQTFSPDTKSSSSTSVSRIPVKYSSPTKLDTANLDKTGASLTENWSPVALTHTSSRQTDDSTSSADEGPEDASGSRLNQPSQANQDGGPRRKGRQSSVHDLVDLYGGAKAREESMKYGLDYDSTPKAPRTQPMLSQSSSTSAGISRTASPKPQWDTRATEKPNKPRLDMNELGRQPIKPPLPTPSPISSTGRARPQSMLIFPVSKSASDGLRISPDPTPSPRLAAPEQPSQRGMRRTSITDMVQLYEVIGNKGKAADPRSSPSKAQLPSDNERQADLPDRRAALSSLSQALNQMPSRPSGPPSPTRQRRVSRIDHQGLSPQEAPPSAEPTRTIFPPVRKTSMNVNPDDAARAAPPARSPSPERPYQGVGKLIDQWQRKANENAAAQRGIPKRVVTSGPTR